MASAARQSYRNISLIFVRFAEIEGFDSYLAEVRAGGRFHDIQVVTVVGDHPRSTCLWAA